MGLPRAARMRRSDFRRSRPTRRRRAVSGPLVVEVVPAAVPGGGLRVGFAVGRPVGTAVVRNRVRRRLRAAAAAALPVGRGGPGAQRAAGHGGGTLVLVRTRPGVERLAVAELTDLLGGAWERVGR